MYKIAIVLFLLCITPLEGISLPVIYNPPADIEEENYPIDRREFVRLENKKMKTKITAISASGQNVDIIDFSRGGIAFVNNNNFTQGNNYKFNLKYQNVTLPIETNVIAIEKKKVRTKFVNLDIPQQNKLLYISSKIQYDNNWLKTKLSGENREEVFEWGI